MMLSMKRLFVLFLLFSATFAAADTARETGCWFLRMNDSHAPKIALPQQTKSVLIENYFRIFYPAGDTFIPDLLSKQQDIFVQSKRILQTEMGWRLPLTRKEANQAELNVYFVAAPKRFSGTVTQDKELAVILNRDTLSANDF